MPSTFSGFGAADLFDETVTRKPAYFGVVAALSGAKNATRVNLKVEPSSSSNGTTNGSSNGTASGASPSPTIAFTGSAHELSLGYGYFVLGLLSLCPFIW